jgi:hypothetical protein
MLITLLNHYYFTNESLTIADYSVAYIAVPPMNGRPDTFSVDPFFTISLQMNLKQ